MRDRLSQLGKNLNVTDADAALSKEADMSETYRYEQIVRTLSRQIERGVLRPGDRMPSLRDTHENVALHAPLQALAHQQAPEDVDEAVLPVAGHGVRLRPGLVSSVEPIGIVGTPSCEFTGVEALDCESVPLARAEALPHVV
jgi:hypothetical protein